MLNLLVYKFVIHALVYTFFYKNSFIGTRGSFLLKTKEQIKNNPASAEEQSLKFSVKV